MQRRTFLQSTLAGLFGAWALRSRHSVAAPPPQGKACILVWLNGGPSHVDTFDPKPGGKITPIKTAVEGIFLSEHLPQLAAAMGKLTLVRGLTSREGNHDRARHLLHTGYAPTPTVHSPSLGAWISAELASSSDLPAFVSVGGPSMGAGFLGVQHGPFVVPTASELPRNTG